MNGVKFRRGSSTSSSCWNPNLHQGQCQTKVSVLTQQWWRGQQVNSALLHYRLAHWYYCHHTQPPPHTPHPNQDLLSPNSQHPQPSWWDMPHGYSLNYSHKSELFNGLYILVNVFTFFVILLLFFCKHCRSEVPWSHLTIKPWFLYHHFWLEKQEVL